MPISATRITPIVGTTIELVAHPRKFILSWDPETQEGDILFEFLEYLRVDGADQAKDFGRHGTVRRKWLDVKDFTPASTGTLDPVTGESLENISIHGVATLILEMFDKGYEQDATP